MVRVACFHKIGEPSEDHMVNSIEQILAFDGRVTFDGAYESVWESYPKLKPFLIYQSPVLFIQGDTVGKDGICSLSQIKTLSQLGFIIGWHGWSHRRLTELNDDEVRAELDKPEWVAPFYAYPHGDWDERVANLVRKYGYICAYSTTQGEEGNDFAIPRVYI